MNLQQLYYFRTLAEVKHFTKAAMKLMVTQPSLSHSISDLEAELGISLFVRTNRMVTLTKYGELFLEYVDQSLNLLDEGRARLEDFISPEQGAVSLHYVSSIDPFVPYLVARYFQKNKSLQTIFQFQQTSNVMIQNALLSGEANLGLGMVWEQVSGLESHKLGDHELVLLVSANHPLARQESVDLRQVRGERFITYRYECVIRWLIDEIFQSLELEPRIVSETIHDTMIYGSVAADLGVALVPAPLGIKHYNIKALPIENEIPKYEVHLRWRNDRYTAPAVSQFRDFVINSKGLFENYRSSLSER